ncbi:MAG TPA: [protein-PII] uridylyltransferase [Nocardioides sp.]|nr:[protein-PII] uridylyltransferase [Nocardioides sp.]
MSAEDRVARTTEADDLCGRAFAKAVQEAGGSPGTTSGISLVAVGGYGRRELAPYSDLDVVLVHDDAAARTGGPDVEQVATSVWYPLWDAGAKIDHSVRAVSEVTAAAHADPRVALGLLDVRHLAGDPHLSLRLRSEVLAHWRRDASHHLPLLRETVERRIEAVGELAHASVPDLKEAYGGLRDATVLKALVATWLVDVPHAELEGCRTRLLDVRDELHDVVGRGADRVPPEVWPELADRLGLETAEAAQRHVRELGRRLTHLSRLTWRRVDGVLARPGGPRARAPELVGVAPGVAVSGAEVVLDRGARPDRDPELLLRAAAEAAERGLALSPVTAGRLAREGAALPEPWPAPARDLLVRLLAAGPGLLTVWETLDETGALGRLLPEWERVRLLPHASVVHRFTVDRHSVETCMEAARLVRRVARPDLLVLAALLHDIGKGGTQEHSVAGEPLARQVALRVGFGPEDAEVVARLVRHHLLLVRTATARDLDDPATIGLVTGAVGAGLVLELLEALTEADARATSTKAWSSWRAALVRDLVARVRAGRTGGPDVPLPDSSGPALASLRAGGEDVERSALVAVRATEHGSTVTVAAPDRVGLIAGVTGALGHLRLTVRSARAWEEDGIGVSVWDVAEQHLDPAVVRERVRAVLDGRLEPRRRETAARRQQPEPVVLVHHGASAAATVLEVRGDDRPGVVHDVCAALAGLGLSIRSAHVTTVGPQAVDVFYVVEPGAGGLQDDRAAEAVHAVRAALSPTVTLGP